MLNIKEEKTLFSRTNWREWNCIWDYGCVHLLHMGIRQDWAHPHTTQRLGLFPDVG